MKKKRLFACLLILILVMVCVLPVSAAGTRTFTHWDISASTKTTVYSKDVYAASHIISTRSLGMREEWTLSDIAADEKGNLFILDDESKIYVVDTSYQFQKTISVTDESGNSVDFTGAKGIFVSGNHIFIGDTANERVLICDKSGHLEKEIIRPDSPIIPDDFIFSPTKMAMDSKGYLYVISEGAYYGALLYDNSYKFMGFYGANTVSTSVLTVLANLWDILFKSDEKRGNEMKKLPYQFVDIALDETDFVYTCTATASGSSGQIRMLSPGGSNILIKNMGSSVIDATGYNFLESDIATRRGESVNQSFVGIQTDEMGFIYALDSIYGIVYVYDTDCNLITAFGGGKTSGQQLGTFSGASVLAVSNGKVLIADNLLQQITVFERTEYGNRVLKAQVMTLDGEYIETESQWKEILSEDQNNRLAISAIAKAAYQREDYSTAKRYAKLAVDRTTYDQAMKKEQSLFISKYFVWVFFAVAALLGLIAYGIGYSKNHNLVLIKNRRLRLATGCCLHPFQAFQEIRYKNGGSIPIAIGMTALFFVTTVIQYVYTDFRFTSFDATTYNPIFQLLTTVGLVVLWSTANWAVSVLQQGKGKWTMVFIVTAYATFPMIIYNVLFTGFSYMISSTSYVFLNGLYIVALIITGVILTVGTMIVHEFSFPRFLFSALLTVFGMILIVFIMFLIGMLISQFWNFVGTVIMEVVYR